MKKMRSEKARRRAKSVVRQFDRNRAVAEARMALEAWLRIHGIR